MTSTTDSSSSSSWIVCQPDGATDSPKESDLINPNDHQFLDEELKKKRKTSCTDSSNGSKIGSDKTSISGSTNNLSENDVAESRTRDGETQTEISGDETLILQELLRKKHAESLNYHEKLQNVLQMQKVELATTARLNAECERLRDRLMEIEQIHSGELKELSEQRDLFETKFIEAEKKFVNYQKSNSIVSNQQIETLSRQLKLVENQRDELLERCEKDSDKFMKLNSRLVNLQCVLEQFQKDKKNEIEMEKSKQNERLQIEIKKRTAVESEKRQLEKQIENFASELNASNRLAEQIDYYQKLLKQSTIEVDILRKENVELNRQFDAFERNQDLKIDKLLIKNLIVNLLSNQTNLWNSLNQNQKHILKVIVATLDFDQTDKDKIDFRNWSTKSSADPEASLSNAFVQFLEKESKNEQTEGLMLMVNSSETSTAKTRSERKIKQEPQLQIRLPTLSNYNDRSPQSNLLSNVLQTQKPSDS